MSKASSPVIIETPHINEIIHDRIGGPRDGYEKVFPLSPSGIHEFFGQYSNGFGCTLKRYLGRCWGWKGFSPHYFLRGAIVDYATEQTVIHFNEYGVMPDFSRDIEPMVRQKIDEMKWQYEFFRVRDFAQWVEDLIDLSMYAACRMDEFEVVETQRKHYLYIGNDNDLFGVNPFDYKWSEAERVHSYFIYGKSDFILDDEQGKTVRDLKCLSGAKKQTTLGKYRFQVQFYGSELLQRGFDVDSTGLLLLYPKRPYEYIIPSPAEEFTVSDYYRVVNTARGVSEVYRDISFNGKNHVIPPKGMGTCTEFNCEYFKACPFGNNDKDSQQLFSERHDRWKEERGFQV